MAKIEKAHLGSLMVEEANLSAAVGAGERNLKDDVMLVQALFKVICVSEGTGDQIFGAMANDLPEPTGVFDEKTMKAIWTFETRMARRLLSVDGKIHPGNYKNRHIKHAFDQNSRLMAITLLNMLAIDGAVMSNTQTGSIIAAVKSVAPSIVLHH